MATVIVGGQFGDEGKGRIVDDFVPKYQYDVVARYNGGDNAGHTVEFEGVQHKLRQVPCGVFNPDVTCIIGNGAVVNAATLVEELEGLRAKGFDADNFMISNCAHLVLPWHKMEDIAAETRRGEEKSIGTTKRGIGPCYESKASRDGLRVEALINGALDDGTVRDVAEYRLGKLRAGREYLGVVPSADSVIEELKRCADVLGKHIDDTGEHLRQARGWGQKILLEGAQGTLLDIDSGSYPNVSSSYVTSAGACQGTGLPPQAIDRVVLAMKAYITRVGNGPLPTELLGVEGEELRKAGHEFGTVTGRARRCGWFDVPIAKHAININGASQMVLTKLDVLSYLPKIPVCTDYLMPLSHRATTSVPQMLGAAKPCVELLDGWQTPLDGIKRWEDLPKQAQAYVQFIQKKLPVTIIAVTTGPARDSVIWLGE